MGERIIPQIEVKAKPETGSKSAAVDLLRMPRSIW